MMCLGKTGLLMSPLSKLITIYGQFSLSPFLWLQSLRIFINKGQFWFHIEIVCWRNCVLFCFPMPGFVTANVLWLPQRWASKVMSILLRKVLPFKNNPVTLQFWEQIHPALLCFHEIVPFSRFVSSRNTSWGNLYRMWSWTDSLWWAIE